MQPVIARQRGDRQRPRSTPYGVGLGWPVSYC
jgi:hypothetical protein